MILRINCLSCILGGQEAWPFQPARNDGNPLFRSNNIRNIKKGIEPMEAIEKASGTYGRFDEAVKKIDQRKE